MFLENGVEVFKEARCLSGTTFRRNTKHNFNIFKCESNQECTVDVIGNMAPLVSRRMI